ncbi:MAG TPA: hypothetical protein VMZ11_03195 [Mycobacteriales bacterium]|nr:hypothetical protein [Mycobacteriales bacterium]
MTPARRQLVGLLQLRWVMVRSRGVRTLLLLSLLLVGYLAYAIARSGNDLEQAKVATAVELAPVAFLGFVVLAVIAPLTAGGGNEVFPPDQLVAFPIRPRTQFLGGLALAPLNLVWVLQLLTLTAETAFVSRGGSGWRAAATATGYVVCATVLGQALSWWVAGLRQTRTGRRALTVLAVAAVGGSVLAIRFGLGHVIVERTPTRTLVHAVAARPDELTRWAVTTCALLALIAAGLWLGTALCGWALRRPTDTTARVDLGPVRRRTARTGPLAELVAVNRASAWRAPALRRGGLVLAILPGIGAAGAGVPWESLTILPGLVAAGAGLLFGVNAFALDGSGALWMASLPHRPRLVALAKVLVLAETVAAAVFLAALAGGVRSPGSPTPSQLSAIVFSGLACTAVVVAVCLSSSVRRPHHALLRSPRDSIAPPGALALASLKLSAPAAMVGLLFSGAAQSGLVWVPPLLAVPVVALAVLSVLRSLATYDQPLPRARVVSVVSAG